MRGERLESAKNVHLDVELTDDVCLLTAASGRLLKMRLVPLEKGNTALTRRHQHRSDSAEVPSPGGWDARA